VGFCVWLKVNARQRASARAGGRMRVHVCVCVCVFVCVCVRVWVWEKVKERERERGREGGRERAFEKRPSSSLDAHITNARLVCIHVPFELTLVLHLIRISPALDLNKSQKTRYLIQTSPSCIC
jgi:hypothetical protein